MHQVYLSLRLNRLRSHLGLKWIYCDRTKFEVSYVAIALSSQKIGNKYTGNITLLQSYSS
ncbi:hypothetical protein [Brunnivagina elsteri]|uniref:hypothetical protein n=1 Tax=Brunnivagina elsteri TaxID=1247191 RepID=UPI0011789BAD|nr:hypothetical protein [Calothrix elsteri]